MEDLLAHPGRLRCAAKLRLVGVEESERGRSLYPAPHRFADASGTAIGYEDEVVFPVKITPERHGEPVELKLNVDYGLCKTLCIPSQANLSLELPPHTVGKGDDDPLLARFFNLVPKPAETDRLPSLGGVEAKLDDAKPQLIIDVNFPMAPPAPISSSRRLPAPSYRCRSRSGRWKAANSASWWASLRLPRPPRSRASRSL